MANIKILDNGPLAVSGDFKLLDGEDKPIKTEETAYLCRCGLAGNKPFCDGAHDGKFDNKVRA